MFMRSSSILMMRASIVLADELADVARAADVDLAGGQEDRHADVDEQAALDLALHDAPDLVALVVLLDDALPAADAVGLALGEQRRVVLVDALE